MRTLLPALAVSLLTPLTILSAQAAPSWVERSLPIQTATSPFSGGAFERVQSQQLSGRSRRLIRSVIGGAVGGMVGWGIGALVGYQIGGRDCAGDRCQLESVLLGGSAGGTLGLAAGVHLANGRRGNFALDFLSASAVWGFGIGTVFLLEWFKADATPEEQVELRNGQAIILLAIPIVQLITTAQVEVATSRSRGRRQPAGLVVRPLRDGRVALGVGVSF